MYWQNYGLRKVWLDRCLKSLVSDDLTTSHTVNGAKDCLNLYDSNLIIFIDQCEGNRIEKFSLSDI